MKRNRFLKRLASLFLAVVFVFQGNAPVVNAAEYWPEGINTTSPSAIVMELSTGTILYEKNSTEALYPASITKIMTVMIALEHCDLNEIFTSDFLKVNKKPEFIKVSRYLFLFYYI